MSTRETLLHFLEENKGTPVSGSRIADTLGISRAAVWKAVKSLQEDGYTITAVHKKGYRLEESNDILSLQSIYPYIKDPDFFPSIRVYKTLDSTNTTAKELANDGAVSGTVILAEQQTAGKGRLGRSFSSPSAGGIYMSVILRPTAEIETSLLITSAAAVAVSRAVKDVTGAETQIKWVNDVYLNGKKLVGILTEATMDCEARTIDSLVLGIGVNVLDVGFPPEIEDVATSLERELHRRFSRSMLIGGILNELQAVWKDIGTKSFLEEYRRRSFLIGRRINVISPVKTEPGTALDINDMGHLIVKMDSGEIRKLNSGEVSVRRID